MPSLVAQYRAVAWMQLAKIRRGWFFHLLIPVLIAVGVIWLRSLIGFTEIDPEAVRRYVSGAAVLGAVFGTVNAVAHDMARAKESGELEFLATYPVRRAVIVVAVISLPIIYTLPVIAATYIGGWWLLDTPLTFTPIVLPVVVLVALMLASVGVVIGLYLPLRLATTVANLLPLVLMVLTPVLFPATALPTVLAGVGRLLPTTVAVDVVHEAYFQKATLASATKPLLLLLVVTVGVMALVVRMPGWRER